MGSERGHEQALAAREEIGCNNSGGEGELISRPLESKTQEPAK